jgi:hypothetical protein
LKSHVLARPLEVLLGGQFAHTSHHAYFPSQSTRRSLSCRNLSGEMLPRRVSMTEDTTVANHANRMTERTFNPVAP